MNKFSLLFFTLSFTLLLQAQVTKTVTSTAGTLSTTMTETELSTVTSLIILGTIDARDFVTLRDYMPLLAVLDISNVTISAYTGTQGTDGTLINVYPENSIPVVAFYNSISNTDNTTLINVYIPNSVTSIGVAAFARCSSLVSITIPNSVTSIGDVAFSQCSSMVSITIPSSVISISQRSFWKCSSLITVDNDNPNYTSIDGLLFNKSKTTLLQCPTSKTNDYTIPTYVNNINKEAFNGCVNLNSIFIPSTVTNIGLFAFWQCSASIIVDPNNSNYLSLDGVFFDKTKTKLIQCPTSKTGRYTIPSSVTVIGEDAFAFSIGLTSVIIPSTVISIGNLVFASSSGLTSIYVYSTIPAKLGYTVFDFYKKPNCTLYVPSGSKSTYLAADQWKECLNIVEITTALPKVTNASINLYPNPTTDYFQVDGLDGTASISVKDLNGKILLTKQINSNDKININSLSNGIYMIEVNTKEGSILKKIIKN